MYITVVRRTERSSKHILLIKLKIAQHEPHQNQRVSFCAPGVTNFCLICETRLVTIIEYIDDAMSTMIKGNVCFEILFYSNGSNVILVCYYDTVMLSVDVELYFA